MDNAEKRIAKIDELADGISAQVQALRKLIGDKAPDHSREADGQETKLPSVAVVCQGTTWFYTAITAFEWGKHGTWRVRGDCYAIGDDEIWKDTYNYTATTPFSIWQKCREAGVPCCDPPMVTLHSSTPCEDTVRVTNITSIKTNCDGSSGVCGYRQWDTGNGIDPLLTQWGEFCFSANECPAEIRRLCAEAGVPCPEESADEPEPLSVELRGLAGSHRWFSIASMRPCPTKAPAITLVSGSNAYCGDAHEWRVEGTPFSIWQACQEAGVPCCDPPSVLIQGDRWIKIDTLRATEWGSEIAGWFRPHDKWIHTDRTRCNQSPAEIRRLCAEAGVPYPPATVTLHGSNSGREIQWRAIRSAVKHAKGTGTRVEGDRVCAVTGVSAAIDSVAETPAEIRRLCTEEEGVPCPPGEIVVVGYRSGNERRLTTVHHVVAKHESGGPALIVNNRGTTTPIAEIRAQAEAAGIELPEPVVDAGGYTWKSIKRVDVKFVRGCVRTTIQGCNTDLTPAQVCELCELAGWDKPEVRMMLTYCDGHTCEVDPNNISRVEFDAEPHWRHTRIVLRKCVDGNLSGSRCVRESVDQVRAMYVACGQEVG